MLCGTQGCDVVRAALCAVYNSPLNEVESLSCPLHYSDVFMVESSIILPLITFYVGIYFTQVITNVEEVYTFRISRVTRESKVRGCGIGV